MKFSAPLVIYRGAHQLTICTWRLKFHIYMILLQTFAGNKQQSYSIMKMSIFAQWPRWNST